MSGKKSPTLECIEKLFNICDFLDKYPKMWEKMPDNSIGIDISGRYSFKITKAGGSD